MAMQKVITESATHQRERERVERRLPELEKERDAVKRLHLKRRKMPYRMSYSR
jgi:hypothetical protein